MRRIFAGELPQIIKQACFLDELTTCVVARLPRCFAKHLWITSVDEGLIKVVVDNPVLALPARFRQKEIQSRINNKLRSLHMPPATRLVCRVVPLEEAPIYPAHKR